LIKAPAEVSCTAMGSLAEKVLFNLEESAKAASL
jgi:hypothetical protein